MHSVNKGERYNSLFCNFIYYVLFDIVPTVLYRLKIVYQFLKAEPRPGISFSYLCTKFKKYQN